MAGNASGVSLPIAGPLALQVAAWLDWQHMAGVTDCLADPFADPLPAAPVRAAAARPQRTFSTAEALAEATALAAGASSLAALHDAVARFEGCALKATASTLCFAAGAPDARLMIVGLAPDADDDLSGTPFSGPAGQLLERMLAAIGLSRAAVWATNTVFWRPPGNREPSTAELAVCRPFLLRQIELLDPDLILILGGPAARTLLGRTEGESRLRGQAFTLDLEGRGAWSARMTFHPARLMAEPINKGLVWRDLQETARLLDHHGGKTRKRAPHRDRPLPRPASDGEPEGDR